MAWPGKAGWAVLGAAWLGAARQGTAGKGNKTLIETFAVVSVSDQRNRRDNENGFESNTDRHRKNPVPNSRDQPFDSTRMGR
jgi:hypothetical protein